MPDIFCDKVLYHPRWIFGLFCIGIDCCKNLIKLLTKACEWNGDFGQTELFKRNFRKCPTKIITSYCSQSITFVDLNEFSSVFPKKNQHSQSRHQKTTAFLVRIYLKVKFSSIHKSRGKIMGASRGCYFLQFSQKIDGFKQNESKGC